MGKGCHPPKSPQGQLSRKDKRKMLRKQKKQRRVAFHQKKSFDKIQNISSTNVRKTSNINNQKPHNLSIHNKNKKITDNSFVQRSQKEQNKKQPKPAKKVEQKRKKTKQELQNEAQILRQQKEIEYYEKLLGVNKNKGKYKGIAKGLGYEDDLFDFLDGISKRIKQGGATKSVNEEYDMQDQGQEYGNSAQFQNQDDYEDEGPDFQQQEEEYQESQNKNQQQSDQEDKQNQYFQDEAQQQSQEYDDQEDQNFADQYEQLSIGQQQMEGEYDQQFQDQIGEQDLDDQQLDMWNNLQNQNIHTKKQKNPNAKNNKNTQNKKEIQQTTKNKPNQPLQKSEGRRPLFGNMTPQQKQQQQIRKQMNAIFNKLSDGNLMISFRQFSQIFLSAPKSSTIPIFVDLFRRFNVQVEKPHLHILLSNIALASALHHLMGNRLMAPLALELIKSFDSYENTPQNFEEIEEIGYSKIFEKKKNLILIFSYLYHFGSLTGDFIHSLVKHLAQSLNEHNVQFLYIIIQKIGSKIRQNDPGVLKNIIDTLKESIQKFKALNSQSGQISKINIIETQLNELKFNRKVELFSDQRMAFFATFLSKNIPKQLNTEKQVFLPSFQQIKNANTSTTTWWQNLEHSNKNNGAGQFQENEEDIEMLNQITNERKKLIELAKSLNLVTEIRKNIFVEIMESSDYLQAAQRVLALRIKNLQQIAVVLIQTCILEPTFNPYYPLVAAKIANINPKFKSKLQFTIWDQIKLLESYDARKTSNLAKFTARFVGNSLTDGSLSILKYFPDLINVHPSEAMFLMIFFTELFNVTKKQTLAQMSSKLKKASNSSVKDSILEYLKQVGVRQKGFNNLQKMKFLRRMIMLNDKEDNDGQRF